MGHNGFLNQTKRLYRRGKPDAQWFFKSSKIALALHEWLCGWIGWSLKAKIKQRIRHA